MPDIEPCYQLWWTAWQDLSTDRQGGGLYAIPYSAIAAYADRHKLDLELLKSIIWGLDDVLLEHERQRLEADRNRKGTPHG